jgi:hypothetical protein
MRSVIAVLWISLASVAGCGADEPGALDAAGADAPPSSATTCGNLSCDRATSVCVACECGGPTSFTCEPIPEGCDSSRTCSCLAPTLCAPTATNPFAMCRDTADNTIDCDRGLD